jgi:hypothetical protein
MFPYERFLAVLKAYVRNRAHPKGSIMEDYTIEKVVECCADYVKDGKWIALPIPLHEGRLRCRRRMGQKTFVNRDYTLVSDAHLVYYNSSQLLGRTSTNTCESYEEITHTLQIPGS